MRRRLLPDLWVESIAQLVPGRLRALGVCGVLLDVDNTLKEHAEANFGPDTTMWVRSLVDAGLAVCLVSNGRAQRIGGLARALEVEFVANALKPSPRGCLRAARRLGIQPSRLVMVGDQVFADILAGRLAGMATVLVTPRSSREPWFTRLKRPFEAWVLRHSAARARFEGAR